MRSETEESKMSTSKNLEELLLEQNRIALKAAEIAAAKEEREAREYAERQAAAEEAKLQRKAKIHNKILRDKQIDQKKFGDQQRCAHLKGIGAHDQNMSLYNLYSHQLPNGVVFIACRNRCGFKWYPGDTRETIVRNGKTLPNPTRWSYEDAYSHLPKKSFSRSTVMRKPPAEQVSA
jgi:hypothetical protein